MESIIGILIAIVVLVIVHTFYLLVLGINSRHRALQGRPVHYVEGMAVCTKTKKLVGLRTPIYRDPKNGELHKGAQQQLYKGVWKCL